ncbi:hypothetical protein EJ03DRAFT_111507 [Teratosphaeria nubilosa]|uniref:Uncharacterized protein n=1 Tax=Teratosphaeria nubilosa TaxID=161662 RepID=A0A6G1L777_9PEZI|nr:hypothetical protein EJ03DRAFT_111507 [Teratosphaeria nubilosa]
MKRIPLIMRRRRHTLHDDHAIPLGTALVPKHILDDLRVGLRGAVGRRLVVVDPPVLRGAGGAPGLREGRHVRVQAVAPVEAVFWARGREECRRQEEGEERGGEHFVQVVVGCLVGGGCLVMRRERGEEQDSWVLCCVHVVRKASFTTCRLSNIPIAMDRLEPV